MPLRGVTGRNSIDGYDFLVGFMYSTVMDLKILGSVGFMSQNVRSRVTTNSGAAVQGNLVSGTVTTHSNLAQTLPELKAGLLYPVYNNFDLTVSYMHVFGANTGRTLTAAASPGSISVNGNINDQNPTLNTILFGLRYNFV